MGRSASGGSSGESVLRKKADYLHLGGEGRWDVVSWVELKRISLLTVRLPKFGGLQALNAFASKYRLEKSWFGTGCIPWARVLAAGRVESIPIKRQLF